MNLFAVLFWSAFATTAVIKWLGLALVSVSWWWWLGAAIAWVGFWFAIILGLMLIAIMSSTSQFRFK